jgi:hypothetical protein
VHNVRPTNTEVLMPPLRLRSQLIRQSVRRHTLTIVRDGSIDRSLLRRVHDLLTPTPPMHGRSDGMFP